MRGTLLKIVIGITLVLAIFGIFLSRGEDNSLRFADNGKDAPIIEIGTKGETISIKPYFSESDQVWYYFLPSYVKDDTLTKNEEYELEYNSSTYKVEIKQSENLEALFISTDSGSLDYLNESKMNSEMGKLVAVDNKGKVEYCDRLKKISGRGNGSWRDEVKRPFSFSLAKSTSLAGLDYGKTYNLHAMCYEGDKLHSKLTYDLADYLGEEFPTSCNWVDVYFNGEYYGLYLLREAQKIEKGRIEIEKDGFLIERDREGSWEGNGEDFFYSGRGETFVFRYPEYPTSEEKEAVVTKANEVEEAIMNQQPLEDLIDTKSFAIQYLCDEISKNFDAFKTSGYFYQKSKSEKVCAGPVWDYDGGYGEFLEEGDIFSDPEGTILGAREGQMAWFHAIIYNEVFNIDKVTLFANSLPWFKEKVEKELDSQADYIRKSVELDELRWKDEKDSLSNRFAAGLYNNYDNEVKYLKWFLAKRLNYLADAWGVDAERIEVPASTGEKHKVVFDNQGEKTEYLIEDGDTLAEIPEGNGMWVIEGTWNPINKYIPIYEDVTLTILEIGE